MIAAIDVAIDAIFTGTFAVCAAVLIHSARRAIVAWCHLRREVGRLEELEGTR